MNIYNSSLLTYYYGNDKKIIKSSNVVITNLLSPVKSVIVRKIKQNPNLRLLIYNELPMDIFDILVIYYSGINNFSSNNLKLKNLEKKHIKLIKSNEKTVIYIDSYIDEKICIIYNLTINNQKNKIYRVV